MGVTKTENFSEKQNQIAALAKVLGHPARIAIIEHLLELNSCVCGTLVNELPLSQATVSQHLKELKTSELIKGEIEGTSVCYCINEKKWNETKLLFQGFFEKFKLSTCC